MDENDEVDDFDETGTQLEESEKYLVQPVVNLLVRIGN
jgi:hypothetical protein